jgi:uncharacterized membrane protein
MQAINLAAPAPLFMLTLFGTAGVGVALCVAAGADWGGAAATYALAGGVASLVPALLTIGYHVPRNNALAALDPAAPEAAGEWSSYVRQWTVGNHVRTLGALAATILLTLSLRA